MSAPHEPPPPVGVPFGRYVIRTRLGRGGMGEVFLADQLGPLGPVRPVALKRLRPALADNPQLVRLFLEEMGTAAQLSHPNIAVTYDFGEVEGVYFLAMEYVDGLPLDQLMRGVGPLPPDAAVHVGQCIAQALHYAHTRQSAGHPAPVVHQDVTPHNIIVARDGETKLLDFGIARTEAAARQGKLRAKVRYAAPEQLRGAPPDRRFDVWGLGVTLYQALCGHLPFPQKDLPARIAASEAGEFVPLAQRAPHAGHLEALIAKALHPNPEGRFEDLAAMRAALLEAHPLASECGPGALQGLVAQVALAPPHLDGGELTSTGVAVEGSGTPPVAPSGPPEFKDDGPTRITRHAVRPRIAAPERPATALEPTAITPAPAPPPRRRALPMILAGLGVGALLVVLGRSLRVPPPVDLVESQPVLHEPPAGVALAPPVPALPPPEDAAVTEDAAPLEDTSAEPPRAPARPRPRKARASRRAPAPARPEPRPTEAEPRPGPDEAAAPNALGLLSVRTVPWSRISVGGRALGEGVIARRPLASGRHVLRLEAGEGEFEAKEVEIDIAVGKTTRVFFDFSTRRLRVSAGQ